MLISLIDERNGVKTSTNISTGSNRGARRSSTCDSNAGDTGGQWRVHFLIYVYKVYF